MSRTVIDIGIPLRMVEQKLLFLADADDVTRALTQALPVALQ
jgi:hypothetical protein